MNKLFFSLCLLLGFISIKSFAQRPEQKEVTISGKIIDNETRQPLEYATIAFFSKRQNKIVTGGITDNQGNFSIPVFTGIYDISIEYISFKTINIPDKKISASENIGTFSLDIDTEALGEVEIIAERTTVEIKLDKKIYNVGKDLTVRGGTVSDVLDNVPSVSVNAEGTVALRGNDNVRILINGKPSGLVGLNSDALKQLPADAIEKVEVITSPSARYEAEGTAGILNIILRRSKLEGFNGAMTTYIGHPESYGISGNINFRTGNVNLFNTLSYRDNQSIGNWYDYRVNKNTRQVFDEKRDWTNYQKGFTNNFGIEWYVTESASITTSFLYSRGDDKRESVNKIKQYTSTGELFSEVLRLDPELEDDKTIQYSFNYTKNFKNPEHKLIFDFQYENDTDISDSDITTNGIGTQTLDTHDDQTNILLKTDYILPVGENSQIELGYRGDYVDRSTDYVVQSLNDQNILVIDTGLSNIFNFRNYVHAAYLQYGSKIKKFSYLLGLRMENTQLTLDQPTSGDFERRHLTGLFPTVNLSYQLSEDESITLGYNRRLSRPRGFFLNPFPSLTSLTNIFQGNPGLNPEYSGAFDLGYLNRFGKFTLSTSLYYQHSINVFEFASRESGETVEIDGEDVAVIIRGPINVSSQDRYGVDFNLNYTPGRKLRLSTDFNLSKEVTDGEFEGINFDNENVNWNARFSSKYTLPWKVDWQTNLRYQGPSKSAQSNNDATFSANVAFSKDLFKEKASIAFSLNDIFNSNVRSGTVNTENFINTREIRFRGGRTYNLSFTYRFNQNKKPERQRSGGGREQEIDM